jgi:hypothetical protein
MKMLTAYQARNEIRIQGTKWMNGSVVGILAYIVRYDKKKKSSLWQMGMSRLEIAPRQTQISLVQESLYVYLLKETAFYEVRTTRC